MNNYLLFFIAGLSTLYLCVSFLGNETGRYIINNKNNYGYDGKPKEDTTFLIDTKTGNTWVYNGSWYAIQHSKY